jgi:hypothetical protein
MKIVVNNLKKTKDDQFSDYLKLKWETKRDSSYSLQQDSSELCSKPGNENVDGKGSNKSKKQLSKLSSR